MRVLGACKRKEPQEKKFRSLRLYYYLVMVGARGFEPPASWTRTMRARQTALRPVKRKQFYHAITFASNLHVIVDS